MSEADTLDSIRKRLKEYGWRFIGGERVWRHETGFVLRLMGGVSNFRVEDAQMRTVAHIQSRKRIREAIVDDVVSQVANLTRELMQSED